MAGRRTDLAEQLRRALDRLKPFAERLGLYLAGGTAIALHLHHRTSRDIDLFGEEPSLDLQRVSDQLGELLGVEIVSQTDAALRLLLDGLPVDIVRYPYRLLTDPGAGPGGFPMAGLEDLAAMKLAAIARRGIRRDFWELYEIAHSGGVSLPHALDSYVRRFGVRQSDLYHLLRSLTYFDDAEADAIMPDGLTQEHWNEIRAWSTKEAVECLRARIST